MTDSRIQDLADPGQTVTETVKVGETDAREFWAVVRIWDHPSEDGQQILCLQNCQLTAEWSDMSDTWLSGSYRQRVPKGDGETTRELAQALAKTAAAQDANAVGE